MKKINIELDIDVKGLGCKGKRNGFGNGQQMMTKEAIKKREELRKVFSGEDFSL